MYGPRDHSRRQATLWYSEVQPRNTSPPRRFPATFTFVVRSFTVLDGIGKSLDPRFDMTEIAAPYARNLLLEARPQFARLQKDLNARLGQQVAPRAILPKLSENPTVLAE